MNFNFRTEYIPENTNFRISHQDSLIIIGSCFSENIGLYLKKYKFRTLINPFGILYNPESIKNSIERIISKSLFKKEDLFFYNDLWNSFEHHGSFSGKEAAESLNKINNSIINAGDFLKEASYLMLTFGSAYVYEYTQSRKIVANCHKVPEKQFSQYLLDLDETVKSYYSLIENIKDFNPGIKIIFTVSPIRYLKYGFAKNQHSKAILILLINKLLKRFPFTEYFPAYEIVLDDLRDYRFYKDDMIHPDKMAVDYIWKAFSMTYFDQKCNEVTKNLDKLIQAKNHRPKNPDSDDHQTFIKKNLALINDLSSKYPKIDFKEDKEFFLSFLKPKYQ